MLFLFNSLLEPVFIFGGIPPNAEVGVYIPALVLASYLIASLGSFTGLQLATDIHRARTPRTKTILHYGGAFAFGTGVWSMHFIGMLAYHMDMVHTYDPALTALSMVIAVAIAYGVLRIIRSDVLSVRHILIGSVLLGAAICGMHYTGMAAMRMDANLRYIPSLFMVSVAIAILTSGAALWIVFTLGQHAGQQKTVWKILAALVMGAAICGMHYTGMAASVFKIVGSGALALEAYEQGSYDLVFMDCHMPDMNGYQATGKIRELEGASGKHTPIIALTADAMVGTHEKCLEAGMDDYISKPIDSEELRDLLGRWIIFPGEEIGNIQSSQEVGKSRMVDLAALTAYADSKEEMQNYCSIFFKKTEEALDLLQGQCLSGRNREWVEITHQIKGSAGMVGASYLSGLCAKAQECEEASAQEREEMFQAIQGAYKNTKELLWKDVFS